MTQFPRVWLGNDRSWALESFSPENVLSHRGSIEVGSGTDADVVVVSSATLAADSAILTAVHNGVGLVLLSPSPGSSVPGIDCVDVIQSGHHGLSAAASESSAGMHPQDSGAPQEISEDLLARVDVERLTPTATLRVTAPSSALLRLPGTSRDPGAVVAATSVIGNSRAVVLGVAMDSQSGDLLFNAITYAARRRDSRAAQRRSAIAQHPAWIRLKDAVVGLRPLQIKDGSVPESHS